MTRSWTVGDLQSDHFPSKLYNKLLHRPTNDVVNFRGRGWVECACIRWERSRKRTHHESWWVRAISTFVKISIEDERERMTLIHLRILLG